MKQAITNLIENILRKSHLTRLREWLISSLPRMRFKNMLSLKSLIILGFVIAVIPQFLAVMNAAFAMQELAALGRTMNYQIFEQTKMVRLVLQKVSDVERKARLFILLADPALRQPYERQSYENTRAAFKQALNALLKLHVDNKIVLLANELSEKENLIYQQIIGAESGNTLKLPFDEAFQGLRESSNTLSREFESHVKHEFNELRLRSEWLENGLFVKGAALLLISFFFITTLLAIFSRSMRQLDAAIRRLGSANLEAPISVTGPSDLRYLGNRLEWLRTHLLELEASKQQFTRNVARQIETPLESIHDGAEQFAREADEESNPAQQDIARMLCANIEKLRTVSKELVRFSQIHAKPEMTLKKTVDLRDLLDSVIEEFQTRLQAKSVTLKKLIRPVELSGVPEQLRSIIEQLMSNAVKFSPVGGEIRIMLRASSTQMELEIEDEGPGIDPDERPHLFEPFFRGRAAQASDAEGPGLGLTIVREYVANHHGKVDLIDSRQDQHGARVRVQIPLNEEI